MIGGHAEVFGMSWSDITPEKPTKKQRRTLYQFSIPRKIVALLDREQATRMIGLLVEAVEQVADTKE